MNQYSLSKYLLNLVSCSLLCLFLWLSPPPLWAQNKNNPQTELVPPQIAELDQPSFVIDQIIYNITGTHISSELLNKELGFLKDLLFSSYSQLLDKLDEVTQDQINKRHFRSISLQVTQAQIEDNRVLVSIMVRVRALSPIFGYPSPKLNSNEAQLGTTIILNNFMDSFSRLTLTANLGVELSPFNLSRWLLKVAYENLVLGNFVLGFSAQQGFQTSQRVNEANEILLRYTYYNSSLSAKVHYEFPYYIFYSLGSTLNLKYAYSFPVDELGERENILNFEGLIGGRVGLDWSLYHSLSYRKMAYIKHMYHGYSLNLSNSYELDSLGQFDVALNPSFVGQLSLWKHVNLSSRWSLLYRAFTDADLSNSLVRGLSPGSAWGFFAVAANIDARVKITPFNNVAEIFLGLYTDILYIRSYDTLFSGRNFRYSLGAELIISLIAFNFDIRLSFGTDLSQPFENYQNHGNRLIGSNSPYQLYIGSAFFY